VTCREAPRAEAGEESEQRCARGGDGNGDGVWVPYVGYWMGRLENEETRMSRVSVFTTNPCTSLPRTPLSKLLGVLSMLKLSNIMQIMNVFYITIMGHAFVQKICVTYDENKSINALQITTVCQEALSIEEAQQLCKPFVTVVAEQS
jgi:hypothetical protein